MSRYYITSTFFLVTLLVSLSLDGKMNFPSWWYIFMIIIYVVITIYGALKLSFSYFFPVKTGGNGTRVSLTFDMNEDSSNIEPILDILRGSGVPAAFFCTGKFVTKHPGIIKTIFDEGHLVGSSGYWKGKLFSLKSSSMIGRELSDTEAAIYAITQKRLRFFRPPFGISSPMLAKAVTRRNYKVVGWKIDFSAETSPENISRRISGELLNGAIIRLDADNKEVVRILDSVIRHLLDKEMELIQLDELIREKAYA